MEKTARKYTDVIVDKTTEHLAANATSASQDAKQKPVATIRVEDCSASIWSREYLIKGQPTAFHSITFERSYKDRDGRYHYTKSFDANSLPHIATLVQQTAAAIADMKQPTAAAA